MPQKRYRSGKSRRKRRSSSGRQKRNKQLLGLIGTGVIVVALIAGVLMNRVLKLQPADPSPETTQESFAQPLHPRLEPLLQIAQSYASSDPHTPPPARALPDTVLLIPSIDMNGDGTGEVLTATLRSSNFELDRNLRRAGFDEAIHSLVVSRGDVAILRIDEYAIRNHLNQRIISQVPAPHGYAFRVYEFEDRYDETPFERPVHVIELVIVDEFGRGMSDEITVYWKPSENTFAATNTFGAPGTF